MIVYLVLLCGVTVRVCLCACIIPKTLVVSHVTLVTGSDTRPVRVIVAGAVVILFVEEVAIYVANNNPMLYELLS